ncbi:MAG: Rpn family recombination-promoting nuclease/putative transposase, partial [Candidatus Thiodiazotropha endolucinida]|nr:Rpn family recombination-promoting nuclease/putative transposase [Candidatus Thiodiazotropha taylori]MCW4290304.1 Rpn family recombination-promoting nuclease/putative transposase [Candidatus Thiodiazotropha endolucinida]
MEATRPFDPLSDLFARALLGDERNTGLLTNFINAFLTPKGLNPVISVDILNPYNLKEYINDKETILDVKARDNHKRIINIEVQISTSKYFANRSLLYWAKSYQSQLHQSEIYTKLNPVICINIVGEPLFPELKEHHTCFHITEMNHPEMILTDHLHIMFMELSKMTFPAEADLAFGSDFERWCYFLKYEGYLKEDEMPVLLGDNPYIQEAHKLYTKFTADEAMLDRLEAKEKWRRDYLSGLDESWNEGREKGREEGREEGR